MRRVTVAAALLAGLTVSATPALADDLVLPSPQAARAQEVTALCTAAGGLPDRCRPSKVPGDVRNDETVLVGLDGAGRPATVRLDQKLLLEGTGDYAIRERGPARGAEALAPGDDPPNTKFGAVVWQGFTPGNRLLGARLTLDPGLEAARLPMTVACSFLAAGAAGDQPLGPGGRIPGRGRITVTLENRTAQPATLPTAADAPAAELARPLDAALAAARRPAGPRLPAAGAQLPSRLQVTGAAQFAGQQAVPLRVAGAVALRGTTGAVTGPGTTPTTAGATVAGTLGGSGRVTLVVDAGGPGYLDLRLDASPALDPRQLAPPAGATSWAAWAAARPDRAARQAALDLLVQVAATAARASSYSPYLGADLPGTGSTTFRYAFAPPAVAVAARSELHAKPRAIALASLALLLLVTNSAMIWRRL